MAGETRRDFLKKTAQAAMVTCAGLTLEQMLSGCAPTLKETRQDVVQIKWDCNPILPIPASGCYVGTNAEASVLNPESEKEVYSRFKEMYGKTPAFNNIGFKYQTGNEFFPEAGCKTAIDLGVIPIIIYGTYPFEGYKQVTKGKFDDVIKQFAHKAAAFESPIILLPFVQPNEPGRQHCIWGGYSASEYKAAWVRMHESFQKEGANKNTLWATKLKLGSWTTFTFPDPFQYIPPKENFDIIGWQFNDPSQPEIGLHSKPLVRQFTSYYNKASKKYQNKPQFFFELSTARNADQAKWWDDSLTNVKDRYYKVKGIIMDVISYHVHPIRFDATQTPETIETIRKHFASGYFLGSAIKK